MFLEKGPSNAIIMYSMNLLSNLPSKKPLPFVKVTDREKLFCGLLDTDLLLISENLK